MVMTMIGNNKTGLTKWNRKIIGATEVKVARALKEGRSIYAYSNCNCYLVLEQMIRKGIIEREGWGKYKLLLDVAETGIITHLDYIVLKTIKEGERKFRKASEIFRYIYRSFGYISYYSVNEAVRRHLQKGWIERKGKYLILTEKGKNVLDVIIKIIGRENREKENILTRCEICGKPLPKGDYRLGKKAKICFCSEECEKEWIKNEEHI